MRSRVGVPTALFDLCGWACSRYFEGAVGIQGGWVDHVLRGKRYWDIC